MSNGNGSRLEIFVEKLLFSTPTVKISSYTILFFFHETLFGTGYKVVVNDLVAEMFSGNSSKPDICHCFEGGMVIINQPDIEDSFLVFL